MAKCRHCGDEIKLHWCDVCHKFITDQCKVDHMEVAHNVVRRQNVHFFGGHDAPRGTTGLDGDPDAYRPAV